ncbi:hypothetical protein [Furfurilactobacillus entadae]|uniref:hypothetical protein n=1 Tax=Furfurilactobacillus entadae TaxID=2922307 RepID=UPI0035E493F3
MTGKYLMPDEVRDKKGIMEKCFPGMSNNQFDIVRTELDFPHMKFGSSDKWWYSVNAVSSWIDEHQKLN